MITAKRENWIDSLKGIAIVCVVLGHILEGTVNKGMFPSTVWMGGLVRIIYSFHMPLFVCVSGVSFYLGIVKKRLEFLGGGWKYVVNLLILYVFWTGVMYFFKHIFKGIVNNVYDKGLLWYLVYEPTETIQWYLILMVWYYLLSFLMGRLPEKWRFGVLLCSLLVSGISPMIYERGVIAKYPYFILYHYVFFLGGVLLPKYLSYVIRNRKRKLTVTGLIAAVFCLININEIRITKIPFLHLLNASVIILVLLYLVPGSKWGEDNRIFSYLGKNSLYIYLLHNYFIVLFRVIYQRLRITMPSVVYVLENLMVTLICCVMVERLIHYIWPLDIFFRPMKTFQHAIKNK